jgi:hypothetical protein
MTLTAPPAMPQRLEAKPSPVVLQAVWPHDRIVLEKSAYRATSDRDITIPVFVYNFSDSPVAGNLAVTAPKAWNVSMPERVELAASERKQLLMHVHPSVTKEHSLERIQLSGDFGTAGNAVLSIRLLLETKKP